MPTYTFTIELRGSGQTQEEAWEDAVDSFALEPGDPGEVEQDDDDFTDIPESTTDVFEFDGN